jgi:hypothetical protein
MVFAWDEHKNRINRRKHAVSFGIAARVFEDPHAISYPDREVNGAERWHTIGLVGGVTVLIGGPHERGTMWRRRNPNRLG